MFGTSSAIVVHGEGFSDPSHPGWLPRDRWQSWNGGGSAGEEDNGVDGPICRPEAVVEYNWQCYESCKAKGYCTPNSVGAERCRWSHCEDDVAFVLVMIERIKARAAVDASRVYATGHSNGGVFVYELASDARTAGLFAAIAPVSGLPHNGFNRGTLNPSMRFLDIGGTQDTFVWHFPNVEGDRTKSYGDCCGWYYSNWRNTSSLWAAHKGLAASSMADIKTRHGLACQGWSSDGTAENADLGVCFYEGGHVSPDAVWGLVWDFFGIPFTGGAQESTPSLNILLVMALIALLAVFLCTRRRSRVKASAD